MGLGDQRAALLAGRTVGGLVLHQVRIAPVHAGAQQIGARRRLRNHCGNS